MFIRAKPTASRHGASYVLLVIVIAVLETGPAGFATVGAVFLAALTRSRSSRADSSVLGCPAFQYSIARESSSSVSSSSAASAGKTSIALSIISQAHRFGSRSTAVQQKEMIMKIINSPDQLSMRWSKVFSGPPDR